MPALFSSRQPRQPDAQDGANDPWFFGFGMAITLLGILAFGHLSAAAMVSTFVVGTIIMLGGLLQLGHALAMRPLDAAPAWAAGGVFYLLAGMSILFEPVAGTEMLTLALALFLGLSGIGRLVIGARLQGSWMLASGAISIMAGTVIAMDWPGNSLWVLGFMVSFDLILLGIAMIATGIGLRWISF